MRQGTRVAILIAIIVLVAVVATLAAGCSSTAPPSSTSTTPSTPKPAPSTPATPAVTGLALGKMIFETGADNSGTIPTKLGMPAVKVNACKNCHGADAKGGGKLPGPDIRGSKLKPDFDQAKFAHAVTTGIDDAGKPLESKMPRFSASPEDTAALWLYLNSLK